MAPRGRKYRNGFSGIWDYWEDTENKGAQILRKKGHLKSFKAGRGLGKRNTLATGYTLEPPSFPLPVEIYRLLIVFRA